LNWKYLVPVSFVILLICFWNRNDFSSDLSVVDELSHDPKQTKVELAPFTVQVNQVAYEIQPLYEYEIYGLVVSYELHDGNYNLHKRWNDHLNIADYCVVWGESASTPFLPEFTFWNGQFTCNFSTKDKQAWESFSPEQLSNNHLVSDVKNIRKKLKKVKVGDQIYIKGWLATYKNLETGGKRETSISREDTGNGACETIYVTDVGVLRSYSSIWKKAMYLSLISFVVCLLMYFKTPYRSRDA